MKKIQNNIIPVLVATSILCLLLPGMVMAELKPMTDMEMKSTRLNDFNRPLNRAIIFGHEDEVKDIEKELRETQAPVLVTAEVYDPEAFLNDMQIQLERINNGEPPAIGLFPFVQNEADKQHLLK
jgi:hypothetical protein